MLTRAGIANMARAHEALARPGFPAARKAVAALEFGLIAPIMALLIVGVFDLSKTAILWEQVRNASRSIAESASTLALPVTPGGKNAITWQNATLALSATFAEIPWLAAGIATGNYSGTGKLPADSVVAVLSSIDYEPPASGCQSNCAYVATVIWSKAYVHTGFNSSSKVVRVCGSTLIQQEPGAGIDAQTIDTKGVSAALVKAGISVPDPLLLADVRLTYTPFFFDFITGKITLSSTSYVPVRISNPGAGVAGTGQTGKTFAYLYDQGDPEANSGSVCNDANPIG